jgi:glycosyltransferase involved in cell wall biosynthesis
MKPTIEVSMIVKDGGATLERCLKSVSTFADRIVIGDTGSTDESIAIARACGAEVVLIPWEDDFSLARNRVLQQRKCDWILVLDADEMLDASAEERIRIAIERPHVSAFHNWRWNYVREASTRLSFHLAKMNPVLIEESRPYPAYVPLPATRLFRGHPGVYFEGCVHETVTWRLAALELTTKFSDFIIHHFGHAEDADLERQRKNDFYQLLGERKLKANEDDPQALIEMGMAELENARRPAVALDHFDHACRVSPASGVGWVFAGICLVQLARPHDALDRLRRASELGMRNAMFFQVAGDANFHGGRFAEACAAYAQVAAMGEDSPLSEAKRGASEVHLGRVQEGIGRIQRAVASAPAFTELYDILATGALLGGDLLLAAETVEMRLKMGKTTAFHEQLAALIVAQSRQQNAIALAAV